VTAQLIDSENGYHKWSENYDKKLEDIFAVQDEIASSIVDQLKKTMSLRKPSEGLVKATTKNIDAYNLYLKGLFYWNKWAPDFVLKAISHFEKATVICPDFALAYARLSACFLYLGAAGFMANKIAYSKAKDYALMAINLDDSLVDSQISKGMVNYFNDWNWEEAEKCFIKALEINPNSAETHQYYAMLLSTLGYHKKALKEAELAHQLDPLNAPISYILSFTYLNNNQIDCAIDQLMMTIEIDPEFGDSWNSLAWIYLKSLQYEKAIEIFNKNLNNPPYKLKALAGLGYIYAKLGQLEKAKEYLALLEKHDSEDSPIEMDLAIIYSGFGEMDKVFDLLNISIDKKLGGLNFINGKYWSEIHSHSRFSEILERMNLPLE
ncbi:MAG: tetratricopeptide repeat protein, partial [Ignavibacteriaceae bacterium]